MAIITRPWRSSCTWVIIWALVQVFLHVSQTPTVRGLLKMATANAELSSQTPSDNGLYHLPYKAKICGVWCTVGVILTGVNEQSFARRCRLIAPRFPQTLILLSVISRLPSQAACGCIPYGSVPLFRSHQIHMLHVTVQPRQINRNKYATDVLGVTEVDLI